MSLILEVSLGEALDKLSILEIKLEKISDIDRKKSVKLECDYLNNKLEEYKNNYEYFYKILKKVNLEIWELQDILRGENSDKNNFYTICDEILNLNDSRYLVKKKLNELDSSSFKEQKGYKLRNLNLILNTTQDIIINLNGAIRYFSFYYDEIHIFCDEKFVDDIKKYYDDDKFIFVNKNKNLNYDYIEFNNDTINKKITHSYFVNKAKITNNNEKYSRDINDLYENLNLNVKIFDEYKK